MRSTTLKRIASAGFAWAVLATGALAFDEKPFDAAAFKSAQDAGKPILIDTYASWCPVCRSQQNVLATLKQDTRYDALTVFRVEYDSQKDALRTFKVTKQSTLIAFKGANETGRSVGDTQGTSIKALIDTTMQ